MCCVVVVGIVMHCYVVVGVVVADVAAYAVVHIVVY